MASDNANATLKNLTDAGIIPHGVESLSALSYAMVNAAGNSVLTTDANGGLTSTGSISVGGLSFTTSLPITNGTSTWRLTTDTANGMSGTELVLTTANGQSVNTLTLRNETNAAGWIAGATFRLANNQEAGAVGVGNGTLDSTYPFDGCLFNETSNIFGATGPSTAPPYRLIHTFLDGSNVVKYFVRAQSKNRGAFSVFANGVYGDGAVALRVGLDGTEANKTLYLQPIANQTIVGPPNFSFPPNAAINFQVTRGPNTPVLFQVLQDGVGGFNIGYPTASSANVIIGSDSSIYTLSFRKGVGSDGTGGTELLGMDASATKVTVNTHLKITSIPTSSAGLSTGDIYSNLGVLTIV